MRTKNQYTKQDYINILTNNEDALASSEIKASALEFIEKNDFPSKKNENWTKTDLKNLLIHKYSHADNVGIDQFTLSIFNITGLG